MDNNRLFLLFTAGIIVVVGYNFGLAIRDIKGINVEQQIEKPEYKQLEVIPFIG